MKVYAGIWNISEKSTLFPLPGGLRPRTPRSGVRTDAPSSSPLLTTLLSHSTPSPFSLPLGYSPLLTFSLPSTFPFQQALTRYPQGSEFNTKLPTMSPEALAHRTEPNFMQILQF